MSPDPQPVFRALSDPTRRKILEHLLVADMSIAEVSEQFDVTRAAIRKHLTILEEGQLIQIEVQGRSRINRIQPEGLRLAMAWMNHFDTFWDERLSLLNKAIDAEKRRKK